MLKKILLIGSSLAITTNVIATDLIITNNTKYDSTSIINHGACSTILGKIGVTHAGETNIIPSSKVKLACLFNRSKCQADVFLTNNCTGPKIATVIFDVDHGIQNISMNDPNYQIIFEGFQISLNSV